MANLHTTKLVGAVRFNGPKNARLRIFERFLGIGARGAGKPLTLDDLTLPVIRVPRRNFCHNCATRLPSFFFMRAIAG